MAMMDQTMKEKLLVGPASVSSRLQVRTPAITWPSALTVGRILLSIIFLLSGIGKFAAWSQSLAYMEAQGMPYASFLLAAAGVVEILGGLSVITGTFARAGAFMLFLFLIPVTIMFHNFWDYEGVLRQMQLGNFLKNLAVMGGLFMIVGGGAGRASVDQKIQQRIARRSGEHEATT